MLAATLLAQESFFNILAPRVNIQHSELLRLYKETPCLSLNEDQKDLAFWRKAGWVIIVTERNNILLFSVMFECTDF